MRAGDLRNRIELQGKTVATSSRGAEVIAWTCLAVLWASVEPMTGREFMEQKQEQGEINLRIRIRYRPDTKPAMRVKWGDRVFDIQSVTNTGERQRETVLFVREVVKYA